MENIKQNQKKISVIIPTLNRENLLRQTLESIKNQTFSYDDFEVIVIDNGSRDHTKEICMNFEKQMHNLRYIYDNRPGLHIGRNRGYLESRANILVFADDDIIAKPTWLEAISRGFEDQDTVLIGGNNYPVFESRQPRWVEKLWTYNVHERAKRLETYSVIVIGDTARRIQPGMVFGCNFAVRKEIIKQAGGFHPDGVPDKYLKYRGDGESYITSYIRDSKRKAMFFPEASVGHVITKERLSEKYVKKVAFRAGISNGYRMLRARKGVNEYAKLIGVYLHKMKEYNLCTHKKSIEKTKEYYFYRGLFYIFFNYIKSSKVRKWIRRDNYINAVIPDSLNNRNIKSYEKG